MKISYIPRKINKHIPHRVTGEFASLKNGKHIVWESQLERDVCYLLERDRFVLSYETQSRTFEYYDQKKIRKYTPDFFVIYKDGRERYYEVKPQKFVENFKKDKELILSELYRENIDFKIITEVQIRCGYFLENIKILERYSRIPVSDITLKLINEIDGNEITIKELSKIISYEYIYHLIYIDFFDVDLNSHVVNDETFLGLIK